MNIPYVFKKCTGCGKWLIACKINFHQNKNGKFELTSKCKKCIREYDYKRKGKKPPEEIPKGYKKCTKCGNILPATIEYFNKLKSGKYGLQGQCKDCQHKYITSDEYKEKRRKYRETSNVYKSYIKSERFKEKENKYRYSEKGKSTIKTYRKNHKEQHKESNYRYRHSNKGKNTYNLYINTEKGQTSRFNAQNKRRIKSENQGKGITPEQWKEMMDFFDWKCAYSNYYIGGVDKRIRSIDHIKPLDNNGVNEIWNCVPMYHSYNSSKRNRPDVITWYKEQEYFSEERLAKIIEWQLYAYDKWATEEDDELILITDLK